MKFKLKYIVFFFLISISLYTQDIKSLLNQYNQINSQKEKLLQQKNVSESKKDSSTNTNKLEKTKDNELGNTREVLSSIEQMFCEIHHNSPYKNNLYYDLLKKRIEEKEILTRYKEIDKYYKYKKTNDKKSLSSDYTDLKNKNYKNFKEEFSDLVVKNDLKELCYIAQDFYFNNNTLVNEPFVKQANYEIFNTQDNLDETVHASVNNNYILGPGDEIEIFVWGKLDKKFSAKLNDSGRINIEAVGSIKLAGVRYQDLNKILKAKFAEKFVNFDISVSMTQLKNINVFVFGEVKKPGEYKVNSSITLLDLLYKAKGVKKSGSLRNIKHLRNGKLVKIYDLYEFMYGLNNVNTIQFENNDVLQINVIKDTIAVLGAVKIPGIYEINKKFTLKNLYDVSGGYNTNSFPFNITINRLSGKTRQFITYSIENLSDMRKKQNKILFQDNDLVYFNESNIDKQKYVAISGEVLIPGKYGYKKNISLGQLISLSGGFTQNAIKSSIELKRFSSPKQSEMFILDPIKDKEFKLKASDEVRVFSLERVVQSQTVEVVGSVKNEGKYEYSENLNVLNVLLKAEIDTFAHENNIEILRRSKDRSAKILQVDFKEIFNNPSSPKNIVLQPNDIISVHAVRSVKKEIKVTLKGEVKYPGIYYLQEDESLSEVLIRAGGYTNDAYLPATVFKRKGIDNSLTTARELSSKFEIQSFLYDKTSQEDTLITPTVQDFQLMRNLRLGIKGNDTRIVIKLDKIIDLKNSINDISLMDGDEITIPQNPKVVTIYGAFQNNINVIYVKNKNAKYYIKQAGGFSKFADKSQLTVFKVDGTVSKDFKNIQSGDVVFVPYEIKQPWYNGVLVFVKVVSGFSVAAAAINVFK